MVEYCLEKGPSKGAYVGEYAISRYISVYPSWKSVDSMHSNRIKHLVMA